MTTKEIIKMNLSWILKSLKINDFQKIHIFIDRDCIIDFPKENLK